MIDEDTSWQRQLLAGAGLLLVVGLLVGGIIGLVALKAADVAGVGGTPTPETGPPPGLGLTTARPETTAPPTRTTRPAPPTRTTRPAPTTLTTRPAPTTPPTTQTLPTFTTPPTTQTTEPAPTTTTTTGTPQPPPQAIQLVATPLQATSFERVSLSGTYPAPAGTVLQVERNRGAGWEEFPTTATVDAGAFSTYVATGILGANQFRVVDTSTGKLSNVVIVMITS